MVNATDDPRVTGDSDPRVTGDSDPRVTGAHVRHLRSGADVGDVTLVGVVHGHPASIHRVRTTLDAVAPDVLALEMPPLAVPLYEAYADCPGCPPVGGEMSAAVSAATTDRVVGVDGPSSAFAARLLRNLALDASSVSTVRSVVGSLGSVTKRAVGRRLAAAAVSRTGLRLAVDPPADHGCDRTDEPAVQASDEQDQIRSARAIAETFAPPETARIRSVTRNQHMARRLSTLRRGGSVAAVVGIAHLDPLADRLDG